MTDGSSQGDEASAPRVLIIGAGVCGLAAGVELTRAGVPVVLVERSAQVGGLSRTLYLEGEAFELGPHIYFDQDEDVVAYWRGLIGDGLKSHVRRNKLYYAGAFIHSPLKLGDALVRIGPVAIVRMLASYLWARRTRKIPGNARDWVVANFGVELFERFFRVYNEKIWGLDSRQVDADWAGQRIKASLPTLILNAFRRGSRESIRTFYFPEGGSDAISEAQERLIRNSPTAEIALDTVPTRIVKQAGGFVVDFAGDRPSERFTHVIATSHLRDIVNLFAAEIDDMIVIQDNLDRLIYRNIVIVNFIYADRDFENMSEHWIDVHDPDVKALRVTNFRNYQKKDNMDIAAVGVEYNFSPGDATDSMTDAEIVSLARADLLRMGLAEADPLAHSVVRIGDAYPVYFKGYKQTLAPIFDALARIDGLILAGRNAMYKWNNMHHSVKTGLLAAQNVMGAKHDLSLIKGKVTLGKESN
jgi:protoporphyrinogen oxidase